jgi:uncharacterized protein YegJ (DUF2314 family)
MIWGLVAVGLALLGAGLYWRHRRRREPRLVSFVALLREPVSFDPAVLANVAGKAWNADLGDGTTEGADGFVAGADVMNTIMHDGRLFLINSFPKPYLEDVEKVAESITDLRIAGLFREHQARFSCDVLGIDGTTPEEEVVECYRRLGKLFAEFLDENCLLVYLPDTQRAYPINDDTETALRSPDPVKALQETLTVPIVHVAADDPLMKEAVEKARESWPGFLSAFEACAGTNFSVKAPVTYADNTEFIWVSVTSVEGDYIHGELGNEPNNLGALKLGSKVKVPLADLNDWAYIDSHGNLTGGFTIEAVKTAYRRGSAK